jgi:Phage integrase, N-terminal SAM-like domain
LAFLARYSGRTLDAHRHDLRGFFQWAADMQLSVLAATRPPIELFRSWMEDRGLAASTIDRRLSTVCASTASPTSTGASRRNPAQYVRRPQVDPSNTRGLSRSELGVFLFTSERCDREHAALAAVIDGMRDRGLIGDDGRLSEQGRAVKQRVEALTDSLAATPYESHVAAARRCDPMATPPTGTVTFLFTANCATRRKPRTPPSRFVPRRAQR